MYYKGHGEVKVDIMLLLLLTTAEPGHLHYDTGYFISLLFLTQMRKKKTFAGNRLSQVSMYVALFTLALIGDSQFCDSQQLYHVEPSIDGSIMVRHMKLILVLSLLIRVYYLMRCTHSALWGVIMNSFDST